MSFRSILLVAAMLSGLAAPAMAAELANGSFELGADPGPGPMDLGTGSTAIAGWTVGGAGLDYVASYWQAADGARSLGLSGPGPSSISQDFATEAGGWYAILFDMSGDPAGGSTTKQLVVSVDGVPQLTQTYQVTAANSRAAMGWQTYFLEFTAFSTMTTLSFASLAADDFGPALDNVMLFDVGAMPSPVPEPLTWALMGIGFATLGTAVRRRAGTSGHAVGNT